MAVDQGGGAATAKPPLRGQLHVQGGLPTYVWGQLIVNAESCDEALCVTVGGFTGQIPGLPAATNAAYVATYTETADYGGSASGTELPGASPLVAVSCPSVSFCVATDASGDVLTSTDPSGSASAWKITHAVVPASNSFSALSCPSVTFWSPSLATGTS